jgi:hypothetical protein
MTGGCLSCLSSTRLTEVGLCVACRDELRFVVRPAAHRETYRRRVAAEAGIRTDLERLGVVLVSSVPPDNSLWICDLCNERIPVTGEYTLIPLIGSYALCIPCATTFPYWPDGWTQPTPRACRCGACQRPVLAALSHL